MGSEQETDEEIHVGDKLVSYIFKAWDKLVIQCKVGVVVINRAFQLFDPG